MKMLRRLAFRMVVPRSVAKYGNGMSKDARKCVITEAWIYGLALAGYQIYTFVLQQRLNDNRNYSTYLARRNYSLFRQAQRDHNLEQSTKGGL